MIDIGVAVNRMTSSVSHPRARTSLTDVGSQSDGLYAFSFMASSDSGSFVLLLLPVLSEKQRAVAVTQETEIMGERIVVDSFHRSPMNADTSNSSVLCGW